MRLFLDSNIMTYIAFFEGYLCEGTRAELDLAIEHWHSTGRNHPDSHMLHEVEALRILYLIESGANQGETSTTLCLIGLSSTDVMSTLKKVGT
jgi:hypothetical protein